MSLNVWTPMLTSNPSLRNKNLRARNKVAHVELLRGDARLVPRYALIATYGNCESSIQQNFQSFGKRIKIRNCFVTTTFGQLLFITQYRMRYAISMPLNAKGFTIELTMVAYENRQKTQQSSHEQTTPIYCEH